jgi:hypothetical protein
VRIGIGASPPVIDRLVYRRRCTERVGRRTAGLELGWMAEDFSVSHAAGWRGRILGVGRLPR